MRSFGCWVPRDAETANSVSVTTSLNSPAQPGSSNWAISLPWSLLSRSLGFHCVCLPFTEADLLSPLFSFQETSSIIPQWCQPGNIMSTRQCSDMRSAFRRHTSRQAARSAPPYRDQLHLKPHTCTHRRALVSCWLPDCEDWGGGNADPNPQSRLPPLSTCSSF